MRAGKRVAAALVASIALAGTVAACGSDDEDSGSDESTEAASAEEVTVTTGDEEGGEFSWEVEPTPTEETKEITFVNESETEHGLVFAKLNEGFTLEEAYELEGRKGSTVPYAEGGAKPGSTETLKLENPVEPGNYVLLCPIPGHYQLGQLEEGEIS